MCLDCYYGDQIIIECEFCRRTFNRKHFDLLKDKVVCPICKRKDYLQQKGGIQIENVRLLSQKQKCSRYLYEVPDLHYRYLTKIKDQYNKVSYKELISQSLGEFIQRKIKVVSKTHLNSFKKRGRAKWKGQKQIPT